ncbi:TetR/AcrR family transcriptional regulator [Amycolatopsis sp.]|uniref:TetR/AcrR family transcriptional regulator n=1 Tax=Amycolatopsis sp. TaxID=37632 RepID=UPI002E04B759|nr:TetR/AcrR family transcriptional regulator [Amycolatopsis sp.]
MTAHAMSGARRPGSGPRQAEAIFTATLQLLEHGYDGLTMEGVAARSGVNKTTIYRWWPAEDALLGAALLDSSLLELAVPDTGSLRGDLLGLTEHVLRLLHTEPTVAVIAGALAANVGRPHLAELAKTYFADRLAKELVVFERAERRGDLRAGVDPMLVLDLLAGAVWARVMIRQAARARRFRRAGRRPGGRRGGGVTRGSPVGPVTMSPVGVRHWSARDGRPARRDGLVCDEIFVEWLITDERRCGPR